MEEWREIIGYNGKYIVSNYGRVKNCKTNNYLGHGKNYKYACLNGKQIFVHRLVGRAFPEICGEWFDGCEIDHIDGNPSNNRAENLKVCTHLENMRNPIALAKHRNISEETRQKMSKWQKGRKATEETKRKMSEKRKGHPVSASARKKIGEAQKKPILQYDKNNVLIREWSQIKDACEYYGILASSVSMCLTHKSKSSGGYIWRYK